jgi:hypothetical protein
MFIKPQNSRASRRSRITTALFVTAITLAPHLHAQTSPDQVAAPEREQLLSDLGASQRIDFSGKLRMLSQRIVASGCNSVAGIAPDSSGSALAASTTEFQTIVDALEFGNPDLGIIGVEERRKTLVGLMSLRESWGPASASADIIISGSGTPETVAIFQDQSAPLLERAQLLVSEISGQYSDPTALLQADALVIDIAGRQRMLAQRMSKNVCLISSGLNADTAQAELALAEQMFDASLFALRSGMAGAGVKPPPNTQIEAGLDTVIADWAQLKPIVDQALTDDPISTEQRSTMFNGTNAMTGNMNAVVGLYSEASKQDL